jgi:sulfonate transport system permease protein
MSVDLFQPDGLARESLPRAARRSAAIGDRRLSRLVVKLSPWSSLLLPGLILLVWAVAAAVHALPSTILPSPAAVALSAAQLIKSGELEGHLLASLRRVLVGAGAGLSLGLVLGLALGMSRRVDAWIGPFFRTVAQIPSLAWIPPLMLVLGIGESLKYVVLAKACLVPVTITTCAGVRNIGDEYLEVARLVKLPRWALFTKVVLPGALPSIFSGFRQGMAHVWTTLIIVEMMASANGIGYLMSWSRQLFQLDVVMVCIVTISAVGFGLDRLLRWGESHLQGWRR